MLQREPVLFELCLQLGPAGAALDASCAAHSVDLEHTVHSTHVNRNRPIEAVPDITRNTTNNRRSASKRNQRCTNVTTPVAKRDDTVVASGIRYQVGRMCEIPHIDTDRLRL